jgi:hypothetical protein
VIPLGTAEAVSAKYHWLTWLAKPEISIPSLLAIFGLYLTGRTKKLEEKNEIRATMLNSVHNDVMHYHMPMASAASAVIQ